MTQVPARCFPFFMPSGLPGPPQHGPPWLQPGPSLPASPAPSHPHSLGTPGLADLPPALLPILQLLPGKSYRLPYPFVETCHLGAVPPSLAALAPRSPPTPAPAGVRPPMVLVCIHHGDEVFLGQTPWSIHLCAHSFVLQAPTWPSGAEGCLFCSLVCPPPLVSITEQALNKYLKSVFVHHPPMYPFIHPFMQQKAL